MRIINTIIKMGLTALITSLIAKVLGLEYWITAGILAVLSTQLTKKDAYNIAIKRILDTVLGLALATVMFLVLGYEFWVFSIFIFIFAYFSFVLKLEVGIVPVLVLVSHLLAEKEFSWLMLLNEFSIMAIAIIVVLIFDLVYPQTAEKEFKKYLDEIDNHLKEHLILIAKFLKRETTKENALVQSEEIIKVFDKTYEQAILLDKDLLFQDGHQYLSYLEMRKVQITHVNHIYQHALKFVVEHQYIMQIAEFIEQLSFDIGYFDKATEQLEKLLDFKHFFKTTALPKTREEFETRAMLYQILNELEYFLIAKIKFHEKNPKFILIERKKLKIS